MESRRRLDPRVEIGHVHLKVADINRAIAFYEEVLGFEVMHREGTSAAFLSAGGYHHHIALNTREAGDGPASPAGAASRFHFAVRYPDRASLAEALRRITAAGVDLERASDHGVSEALYVRDPDRNLVELCWDRPRDLWPRTPDGALAMVTRPLDLEALRVLAEHEAAAAAGLGEPPPLTAATRTRLRDVRLHLLNLHKVLLDDARAAYEMDRGRIGSSASLLQLVISDPWFAWLHPLSELVVRMDEMLQADAPATEADGLTMLEQIERLLTPGLETGRFAERYQEALQRQPAVIMAHAEVRRVLKQGR